MKAGKILVYIVSFVFLLVVFFVYTQFNGTPWGKSEQKKAMISYLSEKYQDDFTIRKVRYNPLGSGYYAVASSEQNPNLNFEVAVSPDTENGYADLYPAVLWDSPVADPLKNYILELFPDLVQSRFTVDRQLEEDVGPNIPTYQSLHYDAGYQSVLMIVLKEDWFGKTEKEQAAVYENIEKLAAYLQTSHFPVLTRIYYDTEDYTNRKAIFITESGNIVEVPQK
ncbi:hypothetical protein [Neobacillus sp. FSL H8-0543]|uniref:YfjL-like protein n=1 Tax=Neobacillus sp. FSL H8-0543 TaxID=2954672 RepID=UPI00315866B4